MLQISEEKLLEKTKVSKEQRWLMRHRNDSMPQKAGGVPIMEKICVVGGRPLTGLIRTHGAKNAVLPVLGAVLLATGPVTIRNCPDLADVRNMCSILSHIGCGVLFSDGVLQIDPTTAACFEMPERISKELRSSIFMLGPVLGRFGRAKFTYPGGCEIGSRPIDLHLRGLRDLNVQVTEEHGYILCDGTKMRGATLHLDYPSVGATENLMMAATAAEGTTVLHNAAREPEICALEQFLRQLGASVSGAGSSTITIEGRRPMRAAVYDVMPDRIAAGTYLAAGAITGGDVRVTGVIPEHLSAALAKFQECGCRLDVGEQEIRLRGPKRLLEMRRIETLPYPGFPTDLQAMFLALASVAEGTSVIVENVFDNRFRTAGELSRLGASITVKDRMAVVRGVPALTGADVEAQDLRGGAALVLAGLRAEGITRVGRARLIDRGYERIEETLGELGAQICRTGPKE